MRKSIAAVGMSAALLGGGAAGVALFGPSAVTAQTAATDAGTNTTATSPPQSPPWVTDALKKLVDAGTINQAQADAVSQALAQAKPPGDRHPGRGPDLAVAAKAIGIDESALRDALQSGQTVAQVAQAHNVDVQKVVDALVADLGSHLASALSDGHLTQAQADQIKADAPQRITAFVNGQRPAGGFHPDGPRPDGPRPDGPPPGGPTDGAPPAGAPAGTASA